MSIAPVIMSKQDFKLVAMGAFVCKLYSEYKIASDQIQGTAAGAEICAAVNSKFKVQFTESDLCKCMVDLRKKGCLTLTKRKVIRTASAARD